MNKKIKFAAFLPLLSLPTTLMSCTLVYNFHNPEEKSSDSSLLANKSYQNFVDSVFFKYQDVKNDYILEQLNIDPIKVRTELKYSWVFARPYFRPNLSTIYTDTTRNSVKTISNYLSNNWLFLLNNIDKISFGFNPYNPNFDKKADKFELSPGINRELKIKDKNFNFIKIDKDQSRLKNYTTYYLIFEKNKFMRLTTFDYEGKIQFQLDYNMFVLEQTPDDPFLFVNNLESWIDGKEKKYYQEKLKDAKDDLEDNFANQKEELESQINSIKALSSSDSDDNLQDDSPSNSNSDDSSTPTPPSSPSSPLLSPPPPPTTTTPSNNLSTTDEASLQALGFTDKADFDKFVENSKSLYGVDDEEDPAKEVLEIYKADFDDKLSKNSTKKPQEIKQQIEKELEVKKKLFRSRNQSSVSRLQQTLFQEVIDESQANTNESPKSKNEEKIEQLEQQIEQKKEELKRNIANLDELINTRLLKQRINRSSFFTDITSDITDFQDKSKFKFSKFSITDIEIEDNKLKTDIEPKVFKNKELNSPEYNKFKKFIDPDLNVTNSLETPDERRTREIINNILELAWKDNNAGKINFLNNQKNPETILKLEEQWNEINENLGKKPISDSLLDEYNNFVSNNWYFILTRIGDFKLQFKNWFLFPDQKNEDGEIIAAHSEEFKKQVANLDTEPEDYVYANNNLDGIQEGDTSILAVNYKDLYISKQNSLINIRVDFSTEEPKIIFNPLIYHFPRTRNKISVKILTQIFHQALFHHNQESYNDFEKDFVEKFRYGLPTQNILRSKNEIKS
ncbi:aromatic motif membrane protein [Mesomycoplasma conjunctivae]|uniref:aromatic motif membrane protein n=1 Tax=Mesomycoplasma conjunctivae TaxID=45361 RepID=UPI003DA3C446